MPTRRQPDDLAHPILEQVRRALWLNRETGLHFPGALLQVEHVPDESADGHCALDVTPAVTDDNGEFDVGAVMVLADLTLGYSFRRLRGVRRRVATVSLAIDLTGVRRVGRIDAIAHVRGLTSGTTSQVGLSDVELLTAAGPLVFGRGTFMLLPVPGGAALSTSPLRTAADYARPLPDFELQPDEQAILERARSSLAAGGPGHFLAGFWDYHARVSGQRAGARMAIGPHVGNRVGHVHGGVLCGLATKTAEAVLGGDWMPSRVSASYLAPGIGKHIDADAVVVHRGSSTAVVRTLLTADTGRTLMDVTSTFLMRGAQRPA
jgi:acyl-coenzyme A thioesterase PaaI-like protein